jgi:Transposase IS66 family
MKTFFVARPTAVLACAFLQFGSAIVLGLFTVSIFSQLKYLGVKAAGTGIALFGGLTHPMAEAVNYAMGQWAELNAFCSDGAVPIDNNISEREMKRVVLNRKNSLFVANPRGGRTAAILASLTSTCRRHDVDPQMYLSQLLINLPVAQMSELSAWLPDQWKIRQAARIPPR